MYLRGDIITVYAKSNDGKPHSAIVVQDNGLNEKSPPSYIICLLASDIYPELDFRPLITPTTTNGLIKPSQVMTDKILAGREIQIGNKIGVISKKCLRETDNNLRLLINL